MSGPDDQSPSADAWKQFDQNPVTHSVAHHLVAIAELEESYGFARVSDVARRLEITRGSASVTLKNLKKRGLVEEDERRYLTLSDEGRVIAQSVRAKKRIMAEFLVDVLGVDRAQADIDTCKIEHLLSDETATGVMRLLEFLRSEHPAVEPFLDAFRGADARTRAELLAYVRASGPGPGSA